MVLAAYLYSVFGALSGYSIFISIVSGVVFAMSIVIYIITTFDDSKEFLPPIAKIMKIFGTAFFIGSAIAIFVPDKDSMKLMMIAYTSQEVLNLQQVQQIGGDAADVATKGLEFLKNYIDGLNQVQQNSSKK